jgi:hypothetical protein
MGYKVKYLCISLICFIALLSSSFKHPYYLGIIDIKKEQETSEFKISVKLFTNDIENAISNIEGKRIDLINPANRLTADSALHSYINKRLSIYVNSIKLKINYLGYEKEDDMIWVYYDHISVRKIKELKIFNSILYDFLPDQSNIIHSEIYGVKKSQKLNNPEQQTTFTYP